MNKPSIQRRTAGFRSAGDAVLGLIVDPLHPDRMAPVFHATAADGQWIVVEISAEEVANLAADAEDLLTADAPKVARWWRRVLELQRANP